MNEWNGKRVEWIFGFSNYFDPLKLHSTHKIEYFDAISKTISMLKAIAQTLHSISFNLNRFSIIGERVLTKSLLALNTKITKLHYNKMAQHQIRSAPWMTAECVTLDSVSHVHTVNTKFVRFQRWKLLFSAYKSLANELWLAQKKRINLKTKFTE